MKSLIVYFAPSNHRSTLVGKALAAGIRARGGTVELKPSTSYRGTPTHDAAIFYGLAQGCRQIFEDYRAKRRALYVDLGYWGRRKRTRWDGYHKIVLNSRHPTAYFQQHEHSADRFLSFGVPIQPWREDGRHILVVGMSAKAAYAEGLKPEEWERDTIARLAQLTKRPLVYRPKPNWPEAKKIAGASFERDQSLPEAFRECHAVVARHSNVAVDALLQGVPCICPHGAASVLSGHDLTQIESPPTPEGRLQWAADLAWTQWSLEEMQSGAAYRYLLAEELI